IAEESACPGFDWAALDHLFEAARSNPGFPKQPDFQKAYWHIHGQAALTRGDLAAALEDFNRALLQQRDYDLLLSQMAEFGSNGFPELGLAHLNY
ncbi:hypothetical protein ABTN34_17050, partial [Acinetobacter baumannii]